MVEFKLIDRSMNTTAQRGFGELIISDFIENLEGDLSESYIFKGVFRQPPLIVIEFHRKGSIENAINWSEAASKPVDEESRIMGYQTMEEIDSDIPGFSESVMNSINIAMKNAFSKAKRRQGILE